MARRRKDKLLEQLSELTDWYWPVGLVVTIVMLVITAFVIKWCLSVPSVDSTSVVGQLFSPFQGLHWIAPVIPALFTIFFGRKTYISWCRE